MVRCLAGKGLGFFLPTVRRETRSHRKTRIHQVPLFPGYVFVEGNRRRQDFGLDDSVVRLLKPAGEAEIRHLHMELWAVWRGLTSGAYLTAVERLAAGELCLITGGPLAGVQGRFEQAGRGGRVILQVDLLGSGVAVEVNASDVQPLE